ELKLGSLNTERYRYFWREMLTRVQMPDIWRKIEIAWQTLEHAFDFKDYSISLLLDSLQEAELQRRTANGAHIEIIDRSLKAHQARLTNVDTLFYGNISTTLADNVFQSENINYYRNKREIALRKINLLRNRRDENTSNIATSTAISKIDSFVEDRENEKRIITTQLQKKLENLWNHLRNLFSHYYKRTEDRQKGYETIKKKDQVDQQTIARQHLRIAILFEEIVKFRGKIASYKKQSAIQLQEIIRESNFFYNIYRETNERFISGYKRDKEKAMIMSKEYNRSVKYMESLMTKAERIHAYMQICRKYETQDEKILPIMDSYPMRLPTIDNDILPLQMAMKDFQRSIHFWRRLGFARLIATELRIKRNQLFAQTDHLRKSVKRSFTNRTS
ncbi:Coiled-coil domain-containing protein 65, partial [Eufriesea mexicana]